jgi:hypothetical protein
MTLARAPLVLLALAALAPAAACSEHVLVDAAMESAYRPARGARLAAAITAGTPYVLLAGDLHCHVTPPDASWHVDRGLPETVALARREGLDFVVLTPHVPAQVFLDEGARAAFLLRDARLRDDVARTPHEGLVLIPGFEYTDHRYGHAGGAFADPAAVLAEVPLDAARADPGLFFERFVARGGVLVVNHPLIVPIASAVPIARADLSWRAWTAPDAGPPPAEIAALDRLAAGFEAYNLAASHLRDGLSRGDPLYSVRATLARIDEAIAAQQRRIAPTAGSDSHAHALRAVIFVLASERSERGVRDALVAGRVCVRGPEACSLRVRGDEGRWRAVGASVHARESVQLRVAAGAEAEVFRDGVSAAMAAPGASARVAVGAACTVLRVRVGGSYSGPVYVNCPFADEPAGAP